MKRCYIAGKISGLPKAEYKANFHQAKQEVRALNMYPVSPLDLPHDHDGSWLSYMREGITYMLRCDCVYALRNWRESKGATIEVELANQLGILIIEQADVHDRQEVADALIIPLRQEGGRQA